MGKQSGGGGTAKGAADKSKPVKNSEASKEADKVASAPVPTRPREKKKP